MKTSTLIWHADINRKERRDRKNNVFNAMPSLCSLCSLWSTIPFLFGLMSFPVSAQVQQAWVARYNNGIPNGTNQAVKMALDSAGNIYITGPSQNTNGILGYATIKYAPGGSQVWAARFDSTNMTSATPAGLALDPSNNVFITGSALTLKYDGNGNQLWTAPYAGTALATDTNGNICVVGYSTDFGTVKLSPAGSNLWSATSPGREGPALSQQVAIDESGNVYVAGNTTFINDQFGTEIDLELVKYDLNGKQLWVVIGGLGYTAEVSSLLLDSMGSAYVLANGLSTPCATFKYAANSNLVWVAYPGGNFNFKQLHGLVLDSGSFILETGQVTTNYGYTGYDTLELDTNGNSIWTTLYFSASADIGISVGTAITVDHAHNVYVTGFSPGINSGNDIVTIKYDNSGNQIWVQRYNGPGNGDDEGNAIAVDALGNVYVTGYETTAAGGTEMVLIKYAPSPTGSKTTNGAFLLQTQGEPGEAFDIQATTNFHTWQDLGLINADTNGFLQFLDTNAPLFNQRFYTTKPK